MLLLRLVTLISLIAFPAFAQQAAMSSAQDRVATQIGLLLIKVESQQDRITQLETDLQKAHAKIKELEKPNGEEQK